jgi:site-specific DNA recombinase
MPSINGHGSSGATERVALYLRVSSEEQRDAGTIQTQRDYLERYVAERGFEVVEVYADDGVSGTFLIRERPEGLRLLDDARDGQFQTVLVYKLDRLGRTQLGILDAADRLERLGVALRSATEHYETATPQGRLMFQMLGSFAEFERSTIKQRTRDGLHREYREGRYMGPIPFGYRGEHGRLEIASEEAGLVRGIFEQIAAGSTLYAVATWLNGLGVRPPSWKYPNEKRPPAKQWSAPTIRTIVRNTTYSGTHTVTLSTGEIIEQTVPAIVEPELQQRALARLEENRRYSGGKKTRNYLLSGLITCAECGCSCVGRTNTARGKKYPYYRCNDDHVLRLYRAPRGHAPNVRAEWLEETVWADVRQFLHDPGAVLERAREQLSSGDAHAELEARHADLSKQLASKHKERDRWLHLYAQGYISDKELETHLADLRAQLDNLKLLLSSVEDELKAQREHVEIAETTEAWLMMLRERVEEVEAATDEAFVNRRELVRLLVERIDVGRDESGKTRVRITYRFGPPSEAGSGQEDAFMNGVEHVPAQLALKLSSNSSGEISKIPPIWKAPAL